MSSHYKDTICALRSHTNAAEFFSLNDKAQREITANTPRNCNILQSSSFIARFECSRATVRKKKCDFNKKLKDKTYSHCHSSISNAATKQLLLHHCDADHTH